MAVQVFERPQGALPDLVLSTLAYGMANSFTEIVSGTLTRVSGPPAPPVLGLPHSPNPHWILVFPALVFGVTYRCDLTVNGSPLGSPTHVTVASPSELSLVSPPANPTVSGRHFVAWGKTDFALTEHKVIWDDDGSSVNGLVLAPPPTIYIVQFKEWHLGPMPRTGKLRIKDSNNDVKEVPNMTVKKDLP
jgi:hypothetical protein